MKISVYQIETITPKNEDEYFMFCDIYNIPSLRYGTTRIITKFSHFISKTELNKIKSIGGYKFYDINCNCMRSGSMTQDGLYFIEYIY